jgi:molybdate/tungstate transport system substrate-binding protein
MARSRRYLQRAGAAVLASLGLVAGVAATGAVAAAPQTVHVAYAGSLLYLFDQVIGPAFHRHTGIAYEGQGGESLAIAREIAAGGIQADIFASLGAAPFKDMGKTYAGWGIAIAESPLVVAFSPHSRFAPTLRKIAAGKLPLSRLFALMQQPGFHLGRTDPATDPQGQAFLLMLKLAQRQFHLSAAALRRITGTVENPSQIFAETSILSEVQSGALDASSAFLPEAKEHHLPYIALPPSLNMADPSDAAEYASVSIRVPPGVTVHGVPEAVVVTVPTTGNQTVGDAMVKFLVSPTGRHLLHEAAFPPDSGIVGSRAKIPATILSALAH